MKFKLTGVLLAFLACFALASCGSKSDKDKSSDEFNDAEKSLNDEIKDLAYRIPPPSEIPYMLEASGAEFNQSLVNDRKKADSYKSQSDKAALNLGVYTADIG